MIILITFSFIAGVVTILSPCILPILPIILSSSSDASNKLKPYGVVTGFILSFTFFTLFLSTLVQLSGIPADTFRLVSIAILFLFGLSLIIPQLTELSEKLFSRLTAFAPNGATKKGFFGGLLIGLSIGLLWTPCVGPILASVISLALSGSVTTDALLITLAYAIGTAIPMFLIIQAGSTALKKVPWLLNNTERIQKVFGVLMILTALSIFLNLDRKFQTFILETFPNYGSGLTSLEDNQTVQNELNKKSDSADPTSFAPTSTTKEYPKAPEILQDGGEWINTEKKLTLSELKGKVVLIDFWTYSCINCQRTLPYLKEWWRKYKDDGLVIIGIHAPEFEFEKSITNVNKAVNDFQISYPLKQDNDFSTWRAYKNRYWPAKYLIDKDGYIRYTHFGEGEYDQTEQMIQTLLKEHGQNVSQKEISNAEKVNFSKTPELYIGSKRIEHLSSPEKIVDNKLTIFSKPTILKKNTFAFEGEWIVTPEYANPQKKAKLILNFEAKEVYLVMKPKSETPSKVNVLLDQKVQSLGKDVDSSGTLTVSADTLYHLISLPNPGNHTVTLEFEDQNTEVYAFTFG